MSRIGKATNFKFCTHVSYSLMGSTIGTEQKPIKSIGTIPWAYSGTRKFSGHPYMARRAVIFAVAQLSCCKLLLFWITGTYLLTAVL